MYISLFSYLYRYRHAYLRLQARLLDSFVFHEDDCGDVLEQLRRGKIYQHCASSEAINDWKWTKLFIALY